MILTCPNCATAFAVAPGTLGEKGRMVRCSKCGQRWHATGIAEPPPAPPTTPTPDEPARAAEPVDATARPAPSPTAAATPPPPGPAAQTGGPASKRAEQRSDAAPLADMPPPVPSRLRSRGIGLVTWPLLALVVLALAAAILGRDQIVAMVPGLVPYYRMAGLPLTIESGLQISGLASTRATEDGKTVLVVTGEIHNVSGGDRQLPPVRVALLDADRHEIDSGLFDVPRRVLPPGGMTRFEARLVEPPPNAKSFRVTLRDTP